MTPRFTALDGLRGIAAMMVVFAHLIEAATIDSLAVLAPWVPDLFDLGRYGVQIFFVLSGFVIAHSVQGGVYTPAYLGRFIGRRFVRLDLPYWSVIACEVALLALSGYILAGYDRPLPSISQILANAVYIQTFTGHDHILDIFWTLCYEVQFYLVFVGSLVVIEAMQRRRWVSPWLKQALLAVTFIASLAIYLGLLPYPIPGLFVDRWWQFAIGVMTYYAFMHKGDIRSLIVANGLVCVAAALFAQDSYRVISLVVTVLTSVTLLMMRRWPIVSKTLEWKPLLFLGAISYSLYLIHLSIGWRAVVVLRKIIGDNYSVFVTVAVFAVGVAVSVFAAWLLNLLIERPAMNLARRIQLPKVQ